MGSTRRGRNYSSLQTVGRSALRLPHGERLPIAPNVYSFPRSGREFCAEPQPHTFHGFCRSRVFWAFSTTAKAAQAPVMGMLIAGGILFFCGLRSFVSFLLAPFAAPQPQLLLCLPFCVRWHSLASTSFSLTLGFWAGASQVLSRLCLGRYPPPDRALKPPRGDLRGDFCCGRGFTSVCQGVIP